MPKRKPQPQRIIKQLGADVEMLDCSGLETAGDEFLEFVGLPAKQYAYVTRKRERREKCKGIKKCITFADYKECLFTKQIQRRSMCVISSDKHEIHLDKISKVELSCEDDKREIMDDIIHTLALGHWRLDQDS